MSATLAIGGFAAPPEKRKLFPLRKRTGTAAFHLSKEAVDFGAEDLEQLSKKQAVMLLAEARWGSTTQMCCTHCGTLDAHYWRPKDLRWKCKCCGKTFSVTSNTVLADHKLSLGKILKIVYSWSNGSSGVAALQLRREWKVAYGTVYTLLHKMREGLLRGFNTGVLCGVHEMDGMDVNGRRYREKRNRPQGGRAAGTPMIPEHLLKSQSDKDFVGPPDPPKRGKAASQPLDRRIMMVMRQRGVSKGKGAAATRVAIAITESGRTAIAMATRFASAESVIISDEDPSYAVFGKLFAEHRTINHSQGYSDGKGVSNNQAESFNWRMRRAVEGIHLQVSNKYLTDYASEQAWREDTRKLSTGDKLVHLFRSVLKVGLSQWWRGYSHGKHREEEFLLEGDRPAKGRGKPKGWKAKPPR
jgi:transposase-like protein